MTDETNERLHILNHVRTLRRLRGISRKQLADAVGLNHRTLRHLERQDEPPDLRRVYKLADFFEVAPYELFYRSTRARPATAAPHALNLPTKSHLYDDVLQQLRAQPPALNLMLALLDAGEEDKGSLRDIMNLTSDTLAEQLAFLKNLGLVTEDIEPGPICGRPTRRVFSLTSKGNRVVVEGLVAPEAKLAKDNQNTK